MLTSDEKVRLPEPSYTILDSYNISDAPSRPNAYIRYVLFDKLVFKLILAFIIKGIWLGISKTNILEFI
jgi:hypothetical protein